MEIRDYNYIKPDNRILMENMRAASAGKGITIDMWEFREQVFAKVAKKDITDFCRLLQNNKRLDFDYLKCLTGVDYREYLEMVYSLYSFNYNWSVNIKVKIEAEKPEIKTIIGIYRSADWFEREIWEMFGINIVGHPNLKPLLLVGDEDFYPLRKSFNLEWKEREYEPTKMFR